MMRECIREGFHLANKNIQLVMIRLVVSVIHLISLVVFLGLPVIAAIVYLGFDLAQAKDMIPFIATNPFDFLSQYLGVIALMLISFFLYLSFSSLLFLYALSGTLGVLKSSAVNVQYTFSLSSFFKEAGINFSRLVWLISLVLLVMTLVCIGVMITGGLAAAHANTMMETGSTLELFFSSFALLSMVIFSIFVLLAGLVFGVYSVVVLVTNQEGVLDSIGRTFNFLRHTPRAFLYYLILIAGFIAVYAVFYSLQIFVSVSPFILPLAYTVSMLFQSYLAMVLWSSLIVYYVKSTNYPVYTPAYEI